MIKNIIFDVGRVLVEVNWLQVMKDLGFDGETLERVSKATVFSPAWLEYDASVLPYEELLKKFIANDPEMKEQILLFMEHEQDAIREFSYANEWVKSFKDKGYGCYILSNYPKRTFEISMGERSFEEHMDGAIYSWQVKVSKPNREIYEILLDRYGLKAEECLFMDDTARNLEVAKEFGIHTILFTDKEEAEEELKKIGI
jgi:putative hydrolase of the HAD superfamily